MSKIKSISAQLPAAGEPPEWFAFRTAFKREKMIERRLAAQGLDVYVPLRTVVRVYPSKRKTLRIPLLSTYIFVRLTAKQYTMVLDDPEVYQIVEFDGEVGRVTDDEIKFLRAVLADDGDDADAGFAIEVTDELVAGQRVVVSGGALAGTKGTVFDRAGNHSFHVYLRSLGFGLVMQVDRKLLLPESR